MATLSSKHFYRFTYLRSGHWSNLRIAKLASVDARCESCDHRDLSNDVHHLIYRKLYNVSLDDLVVLCRSCHNQVHEGLEKYRDFMDENGLEKSSWEHVWRVLRWTQLGIHDPSNAAFKARRHAESTERKKTKALAFAEQARERAFKKELRRIEQADRQRITEEMRHMWEPQKRVDRDNELGPIFRDLRQQGACSFLIVPV